tara:strand:+ start:3940 stop:4413 length:474 start_codon:yes stop_codon:yes gene_type:complete
MAVMTTHKKQPKPIALLLEKNHYQKSTSLITKLDMVLQRVLKQHNISGCRIGNIENGSLLIESPTSLWLQRLQFMRSDILSELRQHHSSLISIKIKVNPNLAKISPAQLKTNKPVKKRAQKMSKDIADSFLALAENADPKLKKALQSLAKFSTNKSE